MLIYLLMNVSIYQNHQILNDVNLINQDVKIIYHLKIKYLRLLLNNRSLFIMLLFICFILGIKGMHR
jgi:hypothetical protein